MKITKAMVKTFADLSGDHNLIHIDENYAKETKFKKCIAHGTLISGLIGTKIAKTFENPILKALNLDFVSPIYGDEHVEVFFENINTVKHNISFNIIVTTGRKKVDNSRVAVHGKSEIVLRKRWYV